MPDIDLDFPRDIREKLIVARHRALRARARRARRELLDLPLARRDPRPRQGARPAVRRARAARPRHRRRTRSGSREEVASLPTATHASAALARVRRARAREIAGLPRHISQHPGGMVISSAGRSSSSSRCSRPRWQGARSASGTRTRAPTPGFLKIDLLGLGMLSAVEDCVDQIAATARRDDRPLARSRSTTRTSTREIQRADTVGDFQIESRAQMQSLLRTRPENLDDLTIQVALVRPGPIQGRAVHPYIERRQRLREDPASSRRSTTRRWREPLARDARRRRLPGPGARGGDGARRVHASARRRGCGAR